MLLAASLASLAIVTQDQAVLRAAPRDSAQQQVTLWQGDSLEVRGERLGYLQVYDHRRERAGYVKASQVRSTDLKPVEANELMAVVRFLRDTPGAEALGVAYSAAYIKAAPAGQIGAESFDALGTFADRLAQRASRGKASDPTLAAHLEVVASYGVQMKSVERDGKVQLCYEGDAFRRVLALPATEEQKARAALALTRHDCVDPNLRPMERYQLDNWRAEVLNKVDTGKLPDYLQNRIQMRRAGVLASLAFQRARRGEPAQPQGEGAIAALAAVNREGLPDEDLAVYTDAAVRVGASRWAALPAVSPAGKLGIATVAGEPGETCILLTDTQHPANNPLARRCTYGQVWVASASSNAQGTQLALAVQPLDTWRELWLFRKQADGWTVDVIPPATNSPELGYLEFAGWVPGDKQLLTAREAKVEGRYKRTFEVIQLDTLAVQNKADKPESLSVFYKWQAASWKGGTVSLR
ncbi:hypothetical protein [Chitinimonas sp.]|uniref:hypothetical protein n=1 Tax=Chitinimonas sp. TaxID=1934313 RepID=UPI002F92516C